MRDFNAIMIRAQREAVEKQERDEARKRVAKRLRDIDLQQGFARFDAILADIKRIQSRSVKPVAGVRVLARAGQTEIDIHGEIESSMTAVVRQALKFANGQPIVVSIDSGGGDALAGFSIHDELKAYGGMVTAIVSNAFSAASVIAMACKEILIKPSGFLMMHRSHLDDREPAPNEIELINKIDAQMQTIYSYRIPRAKVVELMQRETFLNATEAVRLGLADGIFK